MLNNIELLAPVGSIEALYAAVENGADAVYLGGKMFNARQYASNFSDEDLVNAIKYAHLRNVKVYVTVNTLLDDDELEEVIDYLIFLYNSDVDALIVQDLGLARIIRTLLPDFEIHGSTQMSINNYKGVQFLENLGFKRVVLARELSASEIKFINENTCAELEAFIHGALCVSYSGQCLMSSMIGGRSGNRGRCAQPCRMAYSIIDVKNKKVINPKFKDVYILSPKDLNTIEHLDEIINLGIVSLKVEGRMKKAEYVATIVSKYRKEIDRILGKHDLQISKEDIRDMAQMFNRGFTNGFILGDFGKDFISFDKPNNRGIFIGEVVRTDKDYMYIKLEGELNEGDGIEIINKRGEGKGQIINKIFDCKEYVHKNKGKIIKLKNIKGISSGDKVYKTFDLALNEAVRQTFTQREKYKKFLINMAVEIKIGKPAKLIVWKDNHYVNVTSEEIVERGLKISLKKEKVIKQMSKLGDTPYLAESINVDLEEGAMISISVLNNLRREAVEQLNNKRSNFNHRKVVNSEELNAKVKELFNYPKKELTSHKKISIKIDNNSQFEQLDLKKLERIYLNYNDDIKEQVKELRKNDKEIFISTEKIISNEGLRNLGENIDKIVDEIDGISVSNIGTLEFIKRRYKTAIHCDIGLNTFNSSTVKLLMDNNVESITLSSELKLSQIKNICKNNNVVYEAIAYGYLPVMTTKHCPMSLVKDCKDENHCLNCKFTNGYGLYDRKGMTFEMRRKGSTTTIYNSQPLVAIKHINKIYSSGINFARLDFTIEDNNIKLIQELYYNYINDKIDNNEIERVISELNIEKGYTTGHYFRGVL